MKGKNVNCLKWVSGGYSSKDIKKLDNYMAKEHPSFEKVRGASGKSNCHSYAWYSAAANNIYWINNPEPIFGNTDYWTIWATPMRNIKSGDRMIIRNGITLKHSAVINSPTMCTSKLGHAGVYKTTITEMKDMYGSTIVFYVAK